MSLTRADYQIKFSLISALLSCSRGSPRFNAREVYQKQKGSTSKLSLTCSIGRAMLNSAFNQNKLALMEPLKFKPINHCDKAVADMIDSTSWSNEFNWNEIKEFGAYFTAYQVPVGKVLFAEGQQANYMGLIISGKIRIIKTNSNNQPQSLVTLNQSQTFGEQSLIDESPRSAQASTMEATTFVITTRRQLLGMAEKNPALAFKLLWRVSQILSLRLRSTSYRLVDAGTPN
jgi:CRP/FNR family cyclic AMP-dependent transcriptional regulator